MRMSGCSTVGSLRGLGFTALAREIRPDVLLTVSARSVEYMSPHAARGRASGACSVFARLHAPHEETIRVSTQNVNLLPTGRGVYAMYDRGGRVLYIGKSSRVRARVRGHLRGETGANFFRGWSRQIAEIEVRAACSELEALLAEAELIRKSRPPFNRQMRRWKHYCYLSENGKPYGQLEVCGRPCSGDRCFGPFRSRRLAESVRDVVTEHFRLALCPKDVSDTAGVTPLPGRDAAQLCNRYYHALCSGPCAGRVTEAEYGRRTAECDALLRGEDDSAVRDLELGVETAVRGDRSGNGGQPLPREALTMRFAFEQTETLREAERLVGGLLLMPGPEGRRRTATLTHRGIQFDVLRTDPDDARRMLMEYRRSTRGSNPNGIRRLPTAMLDGLCIAVRQLRRTPDDYRVIKRAEMARLSQAALLTAAFDAGGKSLQG